MEIIKLSVDQILETCPTAADSADGSGELLGGVQAHGEIDYQALGAYVVREFGDGAEMHGSGDDCDISNCVTWPVIRTPAEIRQIAAAIGDKSKAEAVHEAMQEALTALGRMPECLDVRRVAVSVRIGEWEFIAHSEGGR